MDAAKYLEKLNLQKEAPTLAFLNRLISAHQSIISFNNLSVFFNPGKILNLEMPALFEKVILSGSGGYCFENNKVFYYLLKELGYEVESKAGRVLNGMKGDKPRTHRMNIVKIEGTRYLADVGFGRNTPTHAILIGEENTESPFRVSSNEGFHALRLKIKDSFMDLYTFDEAKYQESDFNVGNYYTSTHPDSKFVKELMISRIEKD